MRKQIRIFHTLIHFKHWTRSGAGILISLKKHIKIGVLLFTMSIVTLPAQVFAQTQDTARSKKNINLQEVEIVGQASPEIYSQEARKVTVITRKEIMSFPVGTVQDLLEYAAGVDVRQRNTNGVQADIQIRGGSFDQVMVLLNGVNITDPQTGHFDLDLPVSLSSVERIEVLNGSGARIYGPDAYKGVINIVTKKASNEAYGSLSYGQHNLFRANAAANLSADKTSHLISYSHNRSDGFTHNTDYQIDHLFYQGRVNIKKTDLFWQTGWNWKNFGANDFYTPSFPDQYEQTRTGFGSLGFSSHGKFHTTGVAYWRSHHDHFLLKRHDPSFYENYHLTNIYGLRLNAGFSSVLGETELGIGNRNENILSTVLGDKRKKPIEVKGTDSTYYTNSYSRNYLNVYLEQKYRIHDLYLSGGFLVNWNSTQKQGIDIFPGLDLSYRLMNEKLRFFASVNRSLRYPTFTDMFYRDPSNEGSRDLKPEKLFAIESGLKYRSKDLNGSLTLFRDKGTDVIDWVWLTVRDLYKAMNISNVTTRGMEIAVDYRFSRPGKRTFRMNSIGLNSAFMNQSKASGSYVSKYSEDYLKTKFIFHLGHSIARNILVDWQVSYLSRNGTYLDYDPETNTFPEKAFKPYWLLDAKISYLSKYFRLFLEASNLLDSAYTDVGNLIQPGRWINGGIALKFDLGEKSGKFPDFL